MGGATVVRRARCTHPSGTGSYVGNNVYNATGKNQSRSATVRAGKSVTFAIRLQNDGSGADTLLAKGPGSTTAYRITYRAGTTDITSRVKNGTWSTGALAPGASTTITVVVLPDCEGQEGVVDHGVDHRAEQASPTTKDVVKLTATRPA